MKQQRRFFWYAAASAAVVLAIVGITLFSPSPKPIVIPNKELIVGERLNDEDIQLITNGEAILLGNDAQITLSEEGTAEVAQGRNKPGKVKIARNKLSSLIVPYGKRSALTLADGSRVWLNSGSVLKFPAQFGGDRREIHLTSGEIYVEAVYDRGKPFYVQTGNFDVKVYGTQFNISNYPSSPQSVVLVEGSVGLQSKGHKELLITPSEKAVYSGSGTFVTQKIDVNQFVCWKDGYLSFCKTPMSEVLQQIGRYYNLSFDFQNVVNLQKRTCTGKIYLSDNLDNVMETIALLSSTRYEKEDYRIFITNELN